VALVIGPKELAEGTVSLKQLRNEEEQRTVGRADIVAELGALLL
jgi:histidyl-tRNA synthetase